ncbi:MAG: acyl-CoA carboxylase subunit beta [Desulfobacteraceae bacterium]
MGKRMKAAIQRLHDIHQKNLIGGGEEHIERQHRRGKLTARTRIELLVDPGSFRELGSCVDTTGSRIDGRRITAPCDGAVIGCGKIGERWIAVYASDFTVLGGSIGTQHLMKCAKLIDFAATWKIPMVWLLDSSGGRLGYRDVPAAGIAWYFALQSRYSGRIPQINVLLGPCIAGQAYAPTLCDFLLMSRSSAHLWLGGPRMTRAATSETIDETVGGADYHMVHSGTCDMVGDDDEDTIKKARELLGYLPSNYTQQPPVDPVRDDPGRKSQDLADIVPDEYEKSYDMHDVIRQLVDRGHYLEIKKEYARGLIACFARFDGQVVGLVSTNPGEKESPLGINACDKYYRFLQVLVAYNIPLVNLIDTPPVVPGEREEALGLLRHYGKILHVYATAMIPKISVILREAYGDAGAMAMGMGKALGADITYAWPVARIAVEASDADYSKMYGRGIEQDAYPGYLDRARECIYIFEAAQSWSAQVIDEIIEPKDTRKCIIEALCLTRNKQETLPPSAKFHRVPPT